MNIKKFLSVNKKRILGTTLLMSLLFAQTVGAAPTVTGEIVSKGNIEYDANNDGTADVYFYSKDLTSIATGIDALNNDISIMETAMTSLSNQTKTYKDDIIKGLNSNVYAKANIPSDATFEQVIQKINNIPAPTTAVGTYSTGGDNTGLGVGISASTPQADVNIDGVTTLNLGVDEAITLPSGYYPNDITIRNNVANRGSANIILTNTNKTQSLGEGYYSGVTSSTTVTADAKSITYIHHVHSASERNLTISNDDPSPTSVTNVSESNSTMGGCYQIASYTPDYSHHHNVVEMGTGGGQQGPGDRKCPVCGRTPRAEYNASADMTWFECDGYITYSTKYVTNCGYTNGQVIKAEILY